jgi:hypothetical protein
MAILPYTIKIKYSKGPEQAIATFKQRDDAIDYVKAKLQKDKLMRVESIYQLWEMGEMMESFDQSAVPAAPQSSGSSSGAGASSGQNFRPSPLQTSPRPPGAAANNWKDAEDDKKK